MNGRTGVLLLAVLLPVTTLAVDPSGWYWFGPVKWLVVTTVIPAGAAVVLHRGPLRAAGPPTVAATVFVACLAVAAVAGVDPLYAWIGTPERHLGVLAWALCLLALVAGQSIAHRDGAVVATGAVSAGLGVGVLAATEALGWEPLVFDAGRRLTGTFGSSAYLGAATALLVPIAAGVAADGTVRRWVRSAATIAVPLLLLAMFGSGAHAPRGSVCSPAGRCAAIARRQEVAARPRVVAALGTGLLVAAVALAVFTPVGDRVASTFDRDAPGGSGRLDEWHVASKVVADHPVLGVGPEGYRVAFADGVDEDYERAHGRDPLPDRAHAAPLDIALAGGTPALVAWLAFLALCSRYVWRAFRGDRPWLVGVATGIAAYQIAEMLLFPIGELEPAVWLLLGVVIAATARPGEMRERVVPRVAVASLALITALAVVAGGLDVAADRSADAVDALATGGPAQAYDAARHATALRPDEMRLHLLESRAALADERGTSVALAAVDRALDRSPDDPIARRERASLLVERARATLVPDDIEGARQELGSLLADDPLNAALLLLAGQADRLAGDVTGAEDRWLRAESLAPHRSAPASSLALLYLENDRAQDAAAAADRALAIDPEDAAALEVRRRLGER